MRYTDVFVNKAPRHPNLDLTVPQDWTDAMRETIEGFTVVEATNVYEYVKGLSGIDDLYALPCAAPPHDLMIVEWRQHNGKGMLLFAIAHDAVTSGPFVIGDQTKGVEGANGFRRLQRPKVEICGRCARDRHEECLARGYWMEEEAVRFQQPEPPCSCDCWKPEDGFVPRPDMWVSDHLPDQAAWDGVRWTWRVDVYQEDSGTMYGPLSHNFCALDHWGRLVDITYQLQVRFNEPQDAAILFAAQPFSIFLYTLNFMQCANIRTEYVEPSEKLARKHRKKGHIKDGLVCYHVLRLAPSGPASKARSGGSGGGGDGLVAFHPVRGEFHHYGDCCPGLHEPKGLMFGKLTGRFWVPAHVRGNPERGKITRDFEIKPITAVPWEPDGGATTIGP